MCGFRVNLHTLHSTRNVSGMYFIPSLSFHPSSFILLTKIIQKYQVYEDPYTKLTRLDLYKFDGSPMNPMFLAFSPPQMLPTTTMNPTAKATGKASRAKRATPDEIVEPLNKDARHINRNFEQSLLQRIDLNALWWSGVVMAGFGGAAYLF
jgi:hypothetical protein